MKLIVSFLLAAVLLLPGAVAAQEGGLTLDEAVQRIKSRGEVRVLSAETVSNNGRTVYRIKVLTDDGRVKYIQVDPNG